MSDPLKPAIPDDQFVIESANVTLKTLVSYETQYQRDYEPIRKRILALTDFIQARLEALAAKKPPEVSPS